MNWKLMVLKKVNKQFGKFLIVGGVNTLFGYGLFAGFLFLNFHYTVAVLFATVIGVCFNFFTIGRLVFINSENHLFFRFFGVYIVVYLLNVTGLWVFEHFEFSLYLGGAILILPLALVSFTLNRSLVFK